MLRITAASLYKWATCKHATAEAERNAKVAADDSLTSCCIADDESREAWQGGTSKVEKEVKWT